MANTTHLNLIVTDDDSKTFLSWREGLDGTTNSNMTKIDAFAGKISGGTAGQLLVKKSNTAFDFEWIDSPFADIESALEAILGV